MMKTGVWWDMDTCQVPQGFDRYQVRESIELALENYLPFTISAIGDLNRIPEAELKPILSTGFFTKHVRDGPVGIMDDISNWVENNPHAATIILISDHEDTSGFLDMVKHLAIIIIRANAKFPDVSPNYASKKLTWDTILSDNLDSDDYPEFNSWIEKGKKKKYSETAWFCYTCIDSAHHIYAGESFDCLTRHLNSEEHRFMEEQREVEDALSLPNSLPKKTGVWWDIDTCLPPVDRDHPYQVRQSLESAFKDYLPLTISAIGNLKRIPHPLVEAILSTGISMKHCSGGTESIIMDMSMWARYNPPPATLILISDREEKFVGSGLLPSFKERGYTIVRAFQKHPKVAPNYASQTILWDYLLPAWYEGPNPEEVKDKCSETAWHCELCIGSGHPFAGEKLDSLTRHFETVHHRYQELKHKLYGEQAFYREDEMSTESKKTGVWWDINTCRVPHWVDPGSVRQKLESAFSRVLPLTVFAIGNLKPIPPVVLRPIFSTGINLKHDKQGWISISLDMKRWTEENPPPATIILISDREDIFAGSGLLPSFEELGYTIIRAFQNHPTVPPNYASRTILWDHLLSAKNEDTNQAFKGNNTLSETAWHCHICRASGKSYGSLTSHFDSVEHKHQELKRVPQKEEASSQYKRVKLSVSNARQSVSG